MEDTTNQDLVQLLDSAVIDKVEELQRSLGTWLKEIHTASDPLSPVISEKGVWVLSSPLVNTKPLIQAAMRIFSRDLAEKSSGKYRVSEVHLAKRMLYASIYEGETKILTWSLFDAGLEIPAYEAALELEQLIIEKAKEIEAHVKEQREVEAILKSPDAMISNGYYMLYLRSFFRRRKHRQEVAEIRKDLKQTKAQLESELKYLNDQLKEVSENEQVMKCLRFMDIHYQKFPRVKGLRNYDRSYRLERNNKIKQGGPDGT